MNLLTKPGSEFPKLFSEQIGILLEKSRVK